MDAQTAANLFNDDWYMVRKKVFKLFGDAFHVYDSEGRVVAYTRQKGFRLKEDIRIYTDESMEEELLAITTKQILDFSAAYDVIFSPTGEKVGSLRRQGFKSMLRDSWEILDAAEQSIGMVQEDTGLLAFVRRFTDLGSLIPQKFSMTVMGHQCAEIKQRFNPFISKIEVDFSKNADIGLDTRLGLAAVILLSAIEGRQG